MGSLGGVGLGDLTIASLATDYVARSAKSVR